MKKFILNSVKIALILGAVSVVYDQIGEKVAGDYFNLIGWGINIVSVAILVFIGWRLYVGLQSGYLLFDDMDDDY